MITEQKIYEIVGGMISELSSVLEKRFDRIDDRLNSIDKRFDVVDKRFDSLEQGIQNDIRLLGETVYNNFSSLESKFDQLDRNVSEIKDNLDLKSKVGNEGLSLNRDNSARADDEFSRVISKHETRIITLERIVGNK